MYKNPIFSDNIPQKNHQFILQYNIFPKFVKILQICKHFPHNIFPKNSPHPSCFTFQLLRFSGKLLGDRLCIAAES